jgi:hypothetical protein
MNGLNGNNMPGAMVGLPTPAGHQAELNYIYGMVEELSRQLADNKRALDDIVAGVGRVRSRARSQSLGNEELLASAADDFNGTIPKKMSFSLNVSPILLTKNNFSSNLAQGPNLDALVSGLSEALEKAKYSRDANAAMLSQYASVMSVMLKQFHEYKSKHVADVSAWHRSYRTQLAEARAENSRLREQIWEMHAHAGHANDMLRRFRSQYDEDSERWERRVNAKAVRQELRFWKRMAMPELSDTDSYWSDDDDLIDVAEKLRLSELEKKATEEQLANAAAGSSDQGSIEEGELPHQGIPMGALPGGVPMQRDDSAGSALPLSPPRPSSAASTGSSGQ